MKLISAVIIAKNAEDLIADCIDSVAFCDEILVVDGGSTDSTVQLAERAGTRVIVHKNSDFSQMRNKGLQLAQGKWILYIDTDERVSELLKKEILRVVEDAKNSPGAFKIIRKNFYLGNKPWPTTEKLERFFKKKNLKGWSGELHESPHIDGEIGELDGELYHYTHRNLSLMVSKTIIWSKIEAELRFKAGHPPISWWRFPRVMIPVFYNWYITQKGYKAGTVGLIESVYQSFSIFVTYAQLWEMQKDHEKKTQ